jgi:hypothetical protein
MTSFNVQISAGDEASILACNCRKIMAGTASRTNSRVLEQTGMNWRLVTEPRMERDMLAPEG